MQGSHEGGGAFIYRVQRQGFLAEYRQEIEYRFTELYYAITLFSYMSGVKKPKIAFIRGLRQGTENIFRSLTKINIICNIPERRNRS